MILSRRRLALLLSPLALALLLPGAFAQTQRPAPVRLPVEDVRHFAEVLGSIRNHYVDEVSDRQLIENAVKGMVSGLDPHSAFLTGQDYQDLQESTSGQFGGLGMEVSKDSSGIRVITPIDDTPAARAGVQAGDLIVKIDDRGTSDLSLSEGVHLLRGKPGTKVVLTIARKGSHRPIVLTLTRDIIKVVSVKSKELPDGLGYIRISQFQERTTSDLVRALRKLASSDHLHGLVLDLRNNPGGLLNAAIGVSAAFLSENALVVSTRGRKPGDERHFFAVPRDYAVKQERDATAVRSLPAAVKKVPLVVLVNAASASASEIVAGALRDHQRATIMGARTFGKGSVQTIFSLRPTGDQPNAIKITTARYYTPSGQTIQARGISPDIAVDDTAEGNYPSFNLREADLARHLKTSDVAAEIAADDQEEEEDEDGGPDPGKKRYRFGDDDDFQLQQARAFLLGQKVLSHADTLAARKARKAAGAGDQPSSP